jgi:mandelate racemase
MRATETAHWLEWQNWANPVLLQPYEVNSGQILIPERPGFGLDWDEDAVAKHLVG